MLTVFKDFYFEKRGLDYLPSWLCLLTPEENGLGFFFLQRVSSSNISSSFVFPVSFLGVKPCLDTISQMTTALERQGADKGHYSSQEA